MISIYYDPEGYTTKGPKLMGRNAAGESFLRALIQYSPDREFNITTENQSVVPTFIDTMKSYGVEKPVNAIRPWDASSHKKFGGLFYPSPGISDFAWRRGLTGSRAWSLCGITHTTSSAGAMDYLSNIITSPTMPWDALVCTSTAVKTNVLNVLQAQLDFLQQRLQIQKFIVPQLPIIPLGVHTSDFSFSQEDKIAAREALGVSKDSFVVLYIGRLSFHAKAHPLPMYQALQAVATATKRNITLIECGWFGNDQIMKSFGDAAAVVCPDVNVIHLDGRIPANRNRAFSCADIFCSLSDNIQETFGITPIEAMASGLPVVVSDWNGYKDTVRNGIDGFRIQSLMPEPGTGAQLASRYAQGIDSYDRYCGYASSLVSINPVSVADAFTTLLCNEKLRLDMGAAAKKRAVEIYDWANIVPMYLDLWDELGQIRMAETSHDNVRWPARLDPTESFSHYPSATITKNSRIKLIDSSVKESLSRFKTLQGLDMVNFATHLHPSEKDYKAIAQKIIREPVKVSAILDHYDKERQYEVFIAICAIAKLGLIQIEVGDEE